MNLSNTQAPYSAKAIANLIITTASREDKQFDQMQIQKLTYLMHGWHLALLGKPLITDDIEAWQFGPVIPELYKEFKACGRQPINDLATNMHFDDKTMDVVETTPCVDPDDQVTHELAIKILDRYGHLSGPQLSNLTHQTSTPWDETYRDGKGHRHIISNALIEAHFKKLTSQ